MPATYLQAPAIYFQEFQKVVEYISQLLQDKEGVVEYISQFFENNEGVVEYIQQLLHYSITCPPKSLWTSYKFKFNQSADYKHGGANYGVQSKYQFSQKY